MHLVVDRAVGALRRAGVQLDVGLTESELSAVEARFGFVFGADHRLLLGQVLPVGEYWPDWRRDLDSDLLEQVLLPVEGVVAPARVGHFWPPSWGLFPGVGEEAERIARQRLRAWPRLIWLRGNRYMAAGPSAPGAPVLSVHEVDAIYYGSDLHDWVLREFDLGAVPFERMLKRIRHPVPYWDAIATGVPRERM